MNNNTTEVELNNGIKMPLVGYGTAIKGDIAELIYEGIKSGLRLLHSCPYYLNEKEVGEGISKAIEDKLVTREELFIITTLRVEVKHDIEADLKKSLEALGLAYTDLHLDHFPIFKYKGRQDGLDYKTPMQTMWRGMEDLVQKGLARSIGVSNYNVQALDNLLSFCEIKPVINQVEYHPYLVQDELKRYCEANGVYIQAYNSLITGKYVVTHHGEKKELMNLLDEDIIKSLAVKYSTSQEVIALSWAISQNISVIPGTSKIVRLREYLKSSLLKLTPEEVELISELDKGYRFNLTVQYPHLFAGFELFA